VAASLAPRVEVVDGRIVVVQDSLTAQAQPEAPEEQVIIEQTHVSPVPWLWPIYLSARAHRILSLM
jgi:hypothetical protein